MTKPRLARRAALVALAALVAACSESPDPGAGASARGAGGAIEAGEARRSTDAIPAAQDSPQEDGAAAARAALPGLFAIMIGLQGDMERISRGLWTGQFDTIARGARAVADHPTVSPDELQTVRRILGDDIARFKAMDSAVHDRAVRLEAAAAAEGMPAVLEADAALRDGCVTCHIGFRERIRSGIR